MFTVHKNNVIVSLGLYTFRHLLYPSSTGGRYTVLHLSVRPSVQDISRRIFLSNYWWQKSDIWSQASYRYAILWEAFLEPSDSYFLFADLVGFYTHWTYMQGYHKWALLDNVLSCFFRNHLLESNHFVAYLHDREKFELFILMEMSQNQTLREELILRTITFTCRFTHCVNSHYRKSVIFIFMWTKMWVFYLLIYRNCKTDTILEARL